MRVEYNPMWFISNKKSSFFKPGQPILNFGGCTYSGIDAPDRNSNCPNSEISVYIDGFILPRYFCYSEYSGLSQKDLVLLLYEKYGKNLIRYIKGSFNLILFYGDTVYIFNDQHSFRKFFLYKNNDEWIISDELKFISGVIALDPDPEGVALFCLAEHFIGGKTMFRNVYFSAPATQISIKQGNFVEETYIDDDHFFNLKPNSFGHSDFAAFWQTNINNYINFLKPKGASLTLTGGNDSRMILSALINSGIDFNLFSFGDPGSFDVVIASQIAKKINKEFNNYNLLISDNNQFRHLADQILSGGNSLINIHRAHRLSAIQNEINKHPDVEMVFAGFMGGDYIKGLSYDDYITSRYFRLMNSSVDHSIQREQIDELLRMNYFYPEILKDTDFYKELEQFSWSRAGKTSEREFLILYKVIGSMHDMQDTNLFQQEVPYAINPFMDIDFMEMFFASEFSWLKNPGIKKKKGISLDRSFFHVSVTNTLAPQLSDIYYSKKGYYNASELLGNKAVLFVKRILRHLLIRKKYKQNFPMNEWLRLFCLESIERANPSLSALFNFESMKKDLNNLEEIPASEGFWHRFTNSLNIEWNSKQFRETGLWN